MSVNAPCKRVGGQLGIIPDTLRNWVQRQRVDSGAAPGVTTDERTRLVELEREVKELRRANAILKTASAFFAAELDRPRIVIDYTDEHRDQFGVEPICRVQREQGLQIAPSTHRAAKARPPSARSVRDGVVLDRIRTVQPRSRSR